MNRKELIKKYIDFFESKKHKKIPNTSLIQENDPTVLFTTAGMHPLVPFLLGEKHPLGKKLVSVQRCMRTTDIEEIGDLVHHSFFEMLGNWSLGDYWKKESIEMSYEFLIKILGIEKEKLAISVFKGKGEIPKDTESEKAWLSLGISKSRIAYLGKKDNWWGPAGKTGPCGPDTEIFYWAGKGENKKPPKKFNPKDKTWVEIWNNVFMEYNKTKQGMFKPLKQKNVDTGMGVERTVAILNHLKDDYLTDSFKPIINKIQKLSGKKYKENEKHFRIIADHIKSAVFILAEDITPSNSEQGYVLRRLIRRAIRYGKQINLENFSSKIAKTIFKIYSDYKELKDKRNKILKELEKEEEKFNKTLEKGLSKFKSLVKNKKTISGKNAFLLYQSYGFPIEFTQELAKEKNIKVDLKEFEKEFEKHKKLSQTAAKGRFASGLADHSEKTKKLHTATHLLNKTLKQVLDKNIKQKGSNINPKRLRFDFNFPRKLTKEEIEKVEEIVNKKIKQAIPVTKKEISLKKALELGAEAEFGAKYPKKVSVYTIGNFSKEICTGPHVKNTKEIGKFKIIKEQSSAAGVRRIKAIIE